MLTDTNGDVAQSSTTVAVSETAPAVVVDGPYLGAAGVALAFIGSGSEPSSQETSTLTYSWTFGDGATSTLQDPTHTYAGAGTYLVNLTVTNASGLSTTASTTATLTGAAPARRAQ